MLFKNELFEPVYNFRKTEVSYGAPTNQCRGMAAVLAGGIAADSRFYGY
jgi:hypothetical protein